MRFSISTLLWAIFIGYIGHSVWTIYGIFHPPVCSDNHGNRCLKPFISSVKDSAYEISVYFSTANSKVNKPSGSDLTLAYKLGNFSFNDIFERNINITVPVKTRNNGTLYAHAFLHRVGDDPLNNLAVSYAHTSLTTYMVPRAAIFNLMEKNTGAPASVKDKPVTHWYTHVTLNIMTDEISFDRHEIPAEIFRVLREAPSKPGHYLPILQFDEMGKRLNNLIPVNTSVTELPLTLHYAPISVGKLRMWLHLSEAMKTIQTLGFTEKDTDELKGIFSDTNFYFLMLTFVVSMFHLAFDFLAFKNDISFWKNRETIIGVSSRTVVWRCVSTFIIFLYLMDEDTSLLILIPAGIGSIIEMWKVTKAFKLHVTWQGLRLPSISFGARSNQEKETEAYDYEAMKYLSYVLYPLCICGAIYSLMYVEHKSWYSWCVHSLVNGIYAFGFLFMLPQLFVNYKLKSVAHLPWRAFMYKAFNTFIDDVFAFIITMPTAHRLACFRDDVIFVIYLYQRWLYPVDINRVNEYGQVFNGDKDKEKKDN